MSKIAIIGTGYVGLTAGVCFASLGHKVFCVDKNKEKIRRLEKGESPIFEPGIGGLLKKYKKNICFTDNLKNAVWQNDVIFIAVETPTKKDGRFDFRFLKKAINDMKKALRDRKDYKTIVIKSTVPVGTTEWVKEEIKKVYDDNFSIVSNPEFLREGSAINDFLNPDRVVIGVDDKKAKKIMMAIYSKIKAPKVITEIKNAELIKYASNAFLATKISFINEIANICERTKGDIKKVAEGVGLDRRIGNNFLDAGIGYGGSCFPKDIDGLIKYADYKGYHPKLLKAVSLINKKQQENFVKKIERVLKKVKGDTVCIWGLSFKPNTDDIRKSAAVEIIRQLLGKRYRVNVYDPVAAKKAKKELKGKNIKFFRTALEAAKNADVLAIATAWPEFLKADMKKVKKIMRNPNILDGRNIFEPEKIKKLGFYYEGVGRR
jgi:UDPglucose 6-dehydrogenase